MTHRRDQFTVALKKKGVVCPFGVIGGRQIRFFVSVEAVLPEKRAELVDGQETKWTVG